MTLDRRDFLKLAATAGLVVGGLPLIPHARAASRTHRGPFWITIHASGGWDPTLLCDPKGRRSASQLDPVNNYFVDEIQQVGPFRIAPVEGHLEFFERFQNDLLVLNGVDTQTNSHTTGTRYTWCGSMNPGFPGFSAVVAATAESEPTLGFLTNGGYSETAGLVPPTRIPDIDAIQELAFPDHLDPNDLESGQLHHANTLARIQSMREDRYLRRYNAAHLPRVQRSMSLLHNARLGKNELASLSDSLPETLDNSNNKLIKQGQVALACFKAGVTVSANLKIGGFDTHGDHDNEHTPQIQQILEAITAIMNEAESLDIADQLYIIVGSDFGRTPWYNDNMGKDHWSITSMLCMGPGIQGGRVIGATDDYQSPLSVDPVTLALSESGVRIHPSNIHAALRELAGIDQHLNALSWPVGESLPLWGTT